MLARLIFAGATLTMLSPRPAAAQSIIRDSIPGTLVSFELVQIDAVPVAANDETARRLYVGRTEVTWDMYDVFMHRLDTARSKSAADAMARPSQPYAVPDYEWGHSGYAAISITYHAARAFTEWLSAKTGHRYRLPTEFEWEYIAQRAAGGQGQLPPERIDAVAWHARNSSRQAHGIASKKPDALGLHDFFGNVAEWVQSTPPELVTRGGSFRDDPATLGLRSRAVQNGAWTERDPHLPTSTWWLTDGPFVGFRIVRDP
jgi:formylglycine-generating enzyme required for sulfatase activity